MILELAFMGVVVSGSSHPSPPPPATANQQQCKYSVREYSDTYKCYTEEEYQQKEANEAAARQKAGEEVGNFFMWFPRHWWQILVGIVVLLTLRKLYVRWDKKRNPYKYEDWLNY